MVIDIDGFILPASRGREKQYTAQELGWCNWRGFYYNSKHYKPPRQYLQDYDFTLADVKTIKYVKNNVHGLPFYPDSDGDAVDALILEIDIEKIYHKNKTLERTLVAYKGGTWEKYLLDKLQIPSINLEDFNCPKFDDMLKLTSCSSCGHHFQPLRNHCPRVECYHFVHWIRKMTKLPHDMNFVNLDRLERFIDYKLKKCLSNFLFLLFLSMLLGSHAP